MHHTIKSYIVKYTLVSLSLCVTASSHSWAGPIGTPKTSQHASFKPENVERLAVIVKPIKNQRQQFGKFGEQQEQQGQLERMVEQGFMRVLIAGGYTLVSRADLDAAMKEKGLDQANMTDEKFKEAGKMLHVSALLVVSVDAFKTSSPQRAANWNYGGMSRYRPQQPMMEVVAGISARLVKIDDNMVLWTGDLTVNRAILSADQDSIVLAAVAEAIAKTFPPLTPPTPPPAPKKVSTP